MTETSHPLTSQTALQLDSLTAYAAPGSLRVAHDAAAVSQDEEPYTIRCICPYTDDDGHTVQCDVCDTWQHVECYYWPENQAPEIHHCADCSRKQYDSKAATERQQLKRDLVEDEKPKRPATKSHKRKTKDTKQTSVHVNGWSHDKLDGGSPSDPQSGSPREQPAPKRLKTGHKNSNSVSSHIGLNSPSVGAVDAKKHSGAVSHAAKSPPSLGPSMNITAIEPFTLEFMQLYKHDAGDKELTANLYTNLNFINQLHSWLSDPDALHQGYDAQVFQRHDGLDSVPLPHISKKIKTDREAEYHGSYPTWTYLTTDSLVRRGSLVGELKGEMGFLENYKMDERNRWSKLQHPEPFVFFHPQLPIYIDTRREGTLLRYARRSCQPNMEMRIVVTNNTECHVCFLAKEDINAESELTIGWEYPTSIQQYLDRYLQQGQSPRDTQFQTVSKWITCLLANFGGCACRGTTECKLAPFDNRYGGSVTVTPASNSTQANGAKSRKSKKTKKHSSVLNVNSRASSEGPHQDHRDENEDGRSTSGSVNTNSHSRDLTPAFHAPGDIATGLTGTELSDREKRKIAAVEKTFERLDEVQAPRKKKRNSGGSNLNTPGPPTSKQYTGSCPQTTNSLPSTPATALKGGYTDASTSQTQPGSPVSDGAPNRGIAAMSPIKTMWMSAVEATSKVSSPLGHPDYRNASTQTYCEDNSFGRTRVAARTKRPIPYAQRLLKKCEEDRLRFEEEKKLKNQAAEAAKTNPVPSSDVPVGESDLLLPSTASPEKPNLQESPLPVELVLSSPASHIAPADSHTKSSSPVFVSPDSMTAEHGWGNGIIGANLLSTIQPLDPNIQKPAAPNIPRPDVQNGIFPQDDRAGDARLDKTDVARVSGNGTPTVLNAHSTNGHRSSDLKIQLPPTPQFHHNNPSTPSVQGTPSSATASTAQSPFTANPIISRLSPSLGRSSAAQPSPVKKKLSLSEYAARKKADTPILEKGPGIPPTLVGVVTPAAPPVEEAKAPNVLEGSAVSDSP